MTTRPSHGSEDGHPRSQGAADWGSTRYQPVEQIGIGAYGVVYKAKDTSPDATDKDKFVAMKCLRVENTEQGMPLSTVREIALLKQLESLEHPNVVRLLDVCTGRQTVRETQLMLVFEHVDQDLDMFLKSTPESGLEASKVNNIMYQLLTGLDFLHSMRVIHRDLKPQNVLITRSGDIKIADFGLARIYSIDMALTAVVVTLWYRAPEVLLQDSYASPVDLWSVGCIFAELYNRKPLFRGTGDVNQLKKIFEFIGRPSEDEWPLDVAMPFNSFPPQTAQSPLRFVPEMDADAAALLMKLLVFRPSQRLTAKAALEDQFFKDVALSSPEPALFSGEINQAVTYGRGAASTSSSRGRLPYAMMMTRGAAQTSASSPGGHVARVYDPKYGEDPGHEGYDCPDGADPTGAAGISRRSTITPALEQVSTQDNPETSRPRPRAFGNPLPLDARDGASGSRRVDPQPPSPGSAQDSAFLTPPSDLASSSSGSMTSSTSRHSSTSSEPHHQPPPASVGSTGENPTFAAASATDPASCTAPDQAMSETGLVQRRERGQASTSVHSRMSWTTDPLPDPALAPEQLPVPRGGEFPHLGALPHQGAFHTPVSQKVPFEHSDNVASGSDLLKADSSRDSPMPSSGLSSQGSFDSGESHSKQPRPEE